MSPASACPEGAVADAGRRSPPVRAKTEYVRIAKPSRIPVAKAAVDKADAPSLADWTARYVRPCAKSGGRLVC